MGPIFTIFGVTRPQSTILMVDTHTKPLRWLPHSLTAILNLYTYVLLLQINIMFSNKYIKTVTHKALTYPTLKRKIS